MEADHPLSFGDLLREVRLATGLTQAALAERAGISARGLYALERGVSQPHRDTLERLLTALELTPERQAIFRVAAHPSPRKRVPIDRHAAPPPNAVANLTYAAQRTTFIGRERDIERVAELLEQHALVTVTGAAGSGKTRLALEIARRLRDNFRDGVVFVELAALADAKLLPQAIASALDIRERADRSLLAALEESLRSRELLLILDNCEHLTEACGSFVERLQQTTAAIRVLATSREPLAVIGEATWPVEGLNVPPTHAHLSAADLGSFDATRLFVDRARSRLPDYEPSNADADAIASICRRLDGLPLAIELAAARIPHLSAPQIATRLEDALALLTTGPRNAPMRQQTLRATLDWSYGLLSEPERTLFRRLGVFPGSWTLEAAEAVCASGITVFDVLGRLVDRSLVVTIDNGDERRFRMLEIIRQYAREQLKDSGESEEMHSQHLSWCVEFVSSFPFPPPRPPSLEKVFEEHDNLRAALRWAMDNGQTEAAFRLSTWAFWYDRSYSDAVDWFVELFAIPVGRGPSRPRAAALCSAGLLASVHGQFAVARAWFEESLTIAEQLEDQQGIARALSNLGSTIATEDDLARARRYTERALQLAREIGHWGWEVLALRQLGRLDLAEGNLPEAAARARESVALARATGHRWGLTASLCLAGRVAAAEGATERAQECLAESLALAGQLDPGGNQQLMADALLALGDLAVDQSDFGRAREYVTQGLLVSHEAGAPRMISRALEQLGELSFARDPARAVYLAATAVGVRQAFGMLPGDPWLEARLTVRQDRWLTSARNMLGDASFATVWRHGLDLPLEDVVRVAMIPALSEAAAR